MVRVVGKEDGSLGSEKVWLIRTTFLVLKMSNWDLENYI